MTQAHPQDLWEEMSSPNECHYGRCLVVFKDKLVAIGGEIGKLNEWESIPTVQHYDFKNRVWNSVQDMNIARYYHSAAVVSFQHL